MYNNKEKILKNILMNKRNVFLYTQRSIKLNKDLWIPT